MTDFLMAQLIYSQSFCQKSAERKSPKKYYFFHISFWCLTWDTNPDFMSDKPTHYLQHTRLWRLLYFTVGRDKIDLAQVIAIFYLCSEILLEICWEEVAQGILFYVSFWCLTWGLNPGFMVSNKPIHYLLDYDDFFISL